MNELLIPAYDGIELAVRDHGGQGPDVVFVHGVTRTLEDWTPIVQRLRDARAVAMDLRFHGRSGVPEDASWNDFVRDIDAVVNGLGLSNPFVVGHSFGGVVAMAYAIAHPDCPGVVNIDGFDFRQRELYDELDPSVVDAFLADFRANVSVVPPSGGDDRWLAEQRESMRQVDEMWKIPHEVASATRERAFVRTADGWERRPPDPNRFWGFMNVEDGTVDPLAMLRQITGKVVFVLCRPPGDAGMFAIGRARLERHVQAIAAERSNIGIETVAATHGVMFEKPDVIAGMVQALVMA